MLLEVISYLAATWTQNTSPMKAPVHPSLGIWDSIMIAVDLSVLLQNQKQYSADICSIIK